MKSSVVGLNSAYEVACESLDGKTIHKPDSFNGGKPGAGFVLCRNESGEPTAVYGDDSWDFDPYALGTLKVRPFSFASIADERDADADALIAEQKWIMFCLIYFVETGYAGRLSAATLATYFNVLAQAAKFCLGMRSNRFSGKISLQELFTSSVFLAEFVRVYRSGSNFSKCFPGLLNHLRRMGEDVLGYMPINPAELGIKRLRGNQHPVIPVRLYLRLLDHFSGILDEMEVSTSWLPDFIANFKDPSYGVVHENQRPSLERSGWRYSYKPTFSEALSEYDREGFFVGRFSASHRGQLPWVLTRMQFAIKQIIHIFTGMRDQEVMRLPYRCLDIEEVSPATIDDAGVVRDGARVISVLSTTTKFAGYRKEAAWLATEEVVRAVNLAQVICEGVARVAGISLDNAPLFINPNFINQSDSRLVNPFGKIKACKAAMLPADLVIEESDYAELESSDPSRNFRSDPKFAVGEQWPLSSHQYRRSLAFYAINAGFVSLPSLSSQFKHLTQMMTRYYANGSENFKSIFGFYDSDREEFVIPKGHISFDLKHGVPLSVANQVLVDLFEGEEPLFGGTGSYMEQQRQLISDGRVNVQEFRKETEKRVSKGDMAYRKTLLGGCMKVGHCNDFMLANVTACLSCPLSVIKQDKLVSLIAATESEVKRYNPGTGEYEVVSHELELLRDYERRKAARGASK